MFCAAAGGQRRRRGAPGRWPLAGPPRCRPATTTDPGPGDRVIGSVANCAGPRRRPPADVLGLRPPRRPPPPLPERRSGARSERSGPLSAAGAGAQALASDGELAV
ncbi:MAG: hypothetical protein ACK5PF_07000 [bacterium]